MLTIWPVQELYVDVYHPEYLFFTNLLTLTSFNSSYKEYKQNNLDEHYDTPGHHHDCLYGKLPITYVPIQLEERRSENVANILKNQFMVNLN